jgi:tRNA nucleotidyltransferase (CCA-adding enzyme)
MEKLKEIALWFSNFGITLYIVGGAVRDELMGNPIEDVDICIVGEYVPSAIANDFLNLQTHGLIDNFTPVHGSFPIWIVEIDGEKYEFAMARKEKKVGQTRQEFECEVNNVTIEEDLERRDLTINAIAKNIATGDIIDPFCGMVDIRSKIAHPCSTAFKEDPLRVYRAARFIARFELRSTEVLIRFCEDLKPDNISNERVGIELMKMLKTAKKPSLFFNFLREVGWLQYHFPELDACIGVPQNPTHHPEGDVYTHIMHCIDAAQGWFYRAVMLCHDLGKAIVTEIETINIKDVHPEMFEDILKYPQAYKIIAHGHEKEGVQLTKDMLKRIFFADHKTIDKIACLVELHMIRATMSDNNSDRIIRRTMRKLIRYNMYYYELLNVISYDLQGRPPKLAPDDMTLFFDLHGDHAAMLQSSGSMLPIVTGKVLVDLGMEPSPEMGKIIDHALELQDRGTLTKDNWRTVLKGCGYKFFQTTKI